MSGWKFSEDQNHVRHPSDPKVVNDRSEAGTEVFESRTSILSRVKFFEFWVLKSAYPTLYLFLADDAKTELSSAWWAMKNRKLEKWPMDLEFLPKTSESDDEISENSKKVTTDRQTDRQKSPRGRGNLNKTRKKIRRTDRRTDRQKSPRGGGNRPSIPPQYPSIPF